MTSVSLPGRAPRQTALNFDRVAHVYRWAEYLCLGPLLTRVREYFLPKLTQIRRGLVLGDGDGRFLAAWLRAAPHLRVDALDSSPAMLALLRRRCAFAGQRCSTRLATLPDLPPGTPVPGTELVVTHFVLDCMSTRDVACLSATLQDHLEPGALWLVSDFSIPEWQPWRSLGRLYVRSLYLAFRLLTGLRLTTLPAISECLWGAGFRPIHRAVFCKGLLYSELWQLGGQRSSADARGSGTPHPRQRQCHPILCESEPNV